jgi:predicted NACHT family NTPase
LNADDIIKKIRQFYDTDSKKFYSIKEILEIEIAGKAMKRENIRVLHSKLCEGSKAYYQKLTGPNGRFKHLRISDIILAQPQNQWIDQHVIAEGEEDEQRNVLTALPKLWEKSCTHTVILGEGGMGKTVSLIRLWNEYLEKSYEKTPVPVFIALNEYNQISDASKREDFIASMIKKNYGNQMVSHEDIWEIMKAPLFKRRMVSYLL